MYAHEDDPRRGDPPSPPHLWTPKEVAKPMLRVSLHTLYTLIYTGQLKATKVGRQWRLSDRDISDFLGESETADS